MVPAISAKEDLKWGSDYTYVPKDVMDNIETFHTQWEDELLWDFLYVPKPLGDLTILKFGPGSRISSRNGAWDRPSTKTE